MEALAQEIARLQAAAHETRRGAVHEESRAENDKDTRGLEASYLARGQALRVEETVEAQTKLRFMALPTYDEESRIGLGALVEVEVQDDRQWLFLAVAGGGLELTVDAQQIRLVTPASPLGRALVGKEAGDEFTLTIGGRARDYEILEIY